MPRKFHPAVNERAVRLVSEHRQEYASDIVAAEAVASQLGLGRETVRGWRVEADVHACPRDGMASEAEEIKRLKAENRRLREDLAILGAASRSRRRRSFDV